MTKDKPLPKFAILETMGKCRVLEYHGNDYFTVLTNRDRKIYIHRRNIKAFTNK